MFDLQRNLLTTLLGAGIGTLAFACVAIALLMGRPDVAAIQPRGDTSTPQGQVDGPETGLQEFSAYSAIIERPVLCSDHPLPLVEAPSEPEQLAEQEDEAEEISDLEAAVAGIVITPEMKLAMITDEQAGKTLVLREGMSLEGEQAAWKLDAIEPRQVSFVSVDGRRSELGLKVNTSGLKAPVVAQQSRERAAAERSAAAEEEAEPVNRQPEASEEARARAEEIRRRVAERRAQ